MRNQCKSLIYSILHWEGVARCPNLKDDLRVVSVASYYSIHSNKASATGPWGSAEGAFFVCCRFAPDSRFASLRGTKQSRDEVPFGNGICCSVKKRRHQAQLVQIPANHLYSSAAKLPNSDPKISVKSV